MGKPGDRWEPEVSDGIRGCSIYGSRGGRSSGALNVEVDGGDDLEAMHDRHIIEETRVVATDDRVLTNHSDPAPSPLSHVLGDDVGLVLERPDLIVEHPLASCSLRSGPVDARDPKLISYGQTSQGVVGDRRSDDGDDPTPGQFS